MPNLKGYGAKRKFVKRRRFVARKRRTTGVARRNAVGGDLNPNRAIQSPYSSFNALPASMRCNMRYCEYRSLSTGTGLLGTQVQYYLNSVYDPYVATGGHQPYMHDTMAALYNKYRVLNCRVQTLFTTPGASNDILCVMNTTANSSGGITGLQIYQVQEQPGCTWGHLPSSGDRRCVLEGNFSVAKVMGVEPMVVRTGDEYEATVGSNPAKPGFINLNVGAFDGTGGISVQMQIIIEYDTLWYDRTIQGLS